MTGEVHAAPVLLVVIASVFVLGLAWWLARPASFLRRLLVRARCPGNDEFVEMVVVKDQRSSRYVDVVNCAALPHPDHITCAKGCLGCMNKGEPVEEKSAA